MSEPLTPALARSVVGLFRSFDVDRIRSDLLAMGWRFEDGAYYLDVTENVTLMITDGSDDGFPSEVIVNDMSLGEIVAVYTFEYMSTDYLAVETDDGTTILYEIQGAGA